MKNRGRTQSRKRGGETMGREWFSVFAKNYELRTKNYGAVARRPGRAGGSGMWKIRIDRCCDSDQGCGYFGALDRQIVGGGASWIMCMAR